MDHKTPLHHSDCLHSGFVHIFNNARYKISKIACKIHRKNHAYFKFIFIIWEWAPLFYPQILLSAQIRFFLGIYLYILYGKNQRQQQQQQKNLTQIIITQALFVIMNIIQKPREEEDPMCTYVYCMHEQQWATKVVTFDYITVSKFIYQFQNCNVLL